MHESAANCEEIIPMANVPETIDLTKVKIVYGGDMMSLFAVLGLNGPNAAFPCISCEVTKQELVEGKTGTIRTLANLIHCSIKRILPMIDVSPVFVATL